MKPSIIMQIIALSIGTSSARLTLPTRYLNPHHVLSELAPRRRFLKLINIRPKNNLRRRRLDQPSPMLVTSGKRQMYLRCSAIVFTWIALGTLFYSFYNQWPLPQSFFYAVDAGMSIGFCTDVREPNAGEKRTEPLLNTPSILLVLIASVSCLKSHNVASRAFTVIYILLGASCVGGALVLMVQSILEEAAQRTSLRYREILEMDSFKQIFFKGKHRGWLTNLQSMQHELPSDGIISYDEFRTSLERYGCQLSDEEFQRVCQTYDVHRNGYIEYEDFKRFFKGTDKILSTLQYNDKPLLSRLLLWVWRIASPLFVDETKRIYLIFIAYIFLGVTWGVTNQKWDVITATHFAVSALATGGLTAPPVDENGILPAGPAIFCGMYCIFGIPLFALTLSQFASVLVENYIIEEELLAIKRPITDSEFRFASQSLCSSDIGIHLSDYIVLQLFRQGKISLDSFSFMKRHFQLLDANRSGRLNWDEAQTVIQ